MERLNDSDKLYLSKFLEDGRFQKIIDDIRLDLGRDIVETTYSEKEKRDNIYLFSLGLNLLKRKLQDCTNYGDTQDDNK